MYGDPDEYNDIELEDTEVNTDDIECTDMEEFDAWSPNDQAHLVGIHALHLFGEGDMEEADIVDLVDDGLISEAQGQIVMEGAKNIVKLNKVSKLNALTERSILMMARQAKDPEYDKYMKYSALRKKSKAKMKKKYKSRSKSFAKKIQQNAKRKKQQKRGTKKVIGSIASKLRNPNLRGQSTSKM